jgi:hypothetical protein
MIILLTNTHKTKMNMDETSVECYITKKLKSKFQTHSAFLLLTTILHSPSLDCSILPQHFFAIIKWFASTLFNTIIPFFI